EVIAQSRAQLWSSRRDVLAHFERATRSRLDRGMQILLQVQPVLHRRYGYGLEIRDIDPSFTIGDMARRRQEVIDRLGADGLLERNRALTLSPAPLRIAVVSSATAAGWEDFVRRLKQCPEGYAFAATLFEALMQGDGAAKSVVSALSRIAKAACDFDCVAILRGGGSTVDLSCFDGYEIGRAVALFPLPVISGIGHDRDQSVCDLAAHRAAPTPTAAAEMLIARVREFEAGLQTLGDSIARCAMDALARERAALQSRVYRIVSMSQQRVRGETQALQAFARRGSIAVRTAVADHSGRLAALTARAEVYPRVRVAEQTAAIARLERDLAGAARRRMERAGADLDMMSQAVTARDPADVLRRGFSITRLNGRAVRSAGDTPVGARLTTNLFRGHVESVVERTEAGD
ncbi:MAG TPA: exodeoxyribonuclease VII large subunit, partial [Chthonomonadaceae bacterium]|nr:exodeoxyribonuclease VII large subunit [Chthonomonadaceae bacterium]